MLALVSLSKDRILRSNSDEEHLSNGSVCIYAGIEDHRARVAILWVVGWHLDYFVLSAPLRKHATETSIPLTDKYCFEPDELHWLCAWTMTKSIGHDLKSEKDWLSTGAGLERWKNTKRRYWFIRPLTEIKLPIAPGEPLPTEDPE